MTGFVVAVAVLGSGVTAGVLVSTVLGIMPLMQTLSPDRYVVSHRYLWSRYDPFMPICFSCSVLAGGALIVLAPTPASRALFGTAAGLLLAVMVISVAKQVPINRWVKALDPAALPANWPEVDPRTRWRNWNLARTGLACTGFALNVTAIAVLV